MTHLSVNGIDIWCERRGEGAPLLLISGTGGDLRAKPGVMDSPLTRHFDVAGYDQRGLGQSAKPEGPYSMADYADDAAGVIAAQGWDAALVVGISFGGMVAQELAIRHPDRVRRLVLCCTSPGGEGGASYPLHELATLPPQERAARSIPLSNTTHDAAWAQANPDPYAFMMQLRTAAPYADEPRHAEGAALQLEARRRHDAWDRLDQITAPTLVCGGKHDGIALPATQEKLAARIPGARLRMFDGGHLFMIEDRGAFPAMIAFLNGEAA